MIRVQFVSARPYMKASYEELCSLLICLSGKREVVVLCDDELKETLKKVSDKLTPQLSEFKEYLDSQGIEYTENFKGTTTA